MIATPVQKTSRLVIRLNDECGLSLSAIPKKSIDLQQVSIPNKINNLRTRGIGGMIYACWSDGG